MPDEPIDINCEIPLPTSNSEVFVQLRESRPERVAYQIDLLSPDGTVTNIVPPGPIQIPVRHDLGRSAIALGGYKMACVGIVGFVVAGQWDLKLETLVNGAVVNTCGPGKINASQGGASTFRFICTFV
jgi:hypothetical protein